MPVPRQLLRVIPRREPEAPARGQHPRARAPQRAPVRAGPQRQLIPVQGVRDVVSELKKVTWPTREQAVNLTGVVIVVSVAVGLLLGGADFIFYWLVNSVLLKLGT